MGGLVWLGAEIVFGGSFKGVYKGYYRDLI